jgi:hypothetical protein
MRRRWNRKALEIGLGARHCIMQELARLPKPEAVVYSGLLFRNQHIGRERNESAISSWPPSASFVPNVADEAGLGRIPMVVEDPGTAIYKYIITSISGFWPYPDGLHFRPSPAFQESVGKDMACAAREEDTAGYRATMISSPFSDRDHAHRQ